MKLTWRKPLKFFSRSQGRVRFPTGVPHDESYLSPQTALFANTREISLERALLYTASHRQTEGEPVILRRAKATAYILEHVEISIRDEELIAGNRTVKPRAGIMSPEMDPYWLLKELDQFPTRPQDRFAISEEDKRIYREELFPYWENVR